MSLPYRVSTLKNIILALCVFGTMVENINAEARSETWQIVVDAGSSKTRGILYKLSSDTITPIVENSTKNPLASHVHFPENADTQLISPLLDALIKLADDKGYTLEKNNVLVSVLGTAGMRELSPSQQLSIYQSVSEAIHGKGLMTGQVRTIEGWEEGAFAWVHLNYLIGLTGSDKTLGIIEMGGASSQITFASNDPQTDTTHTVQWNKQTYRIVSESLLGLGADAARFAMDRVQQQDQTCYPEGSSKPGSFNFSACDSAYDKAIATDGKSEIQKFERVVNSNDFSHTHFIGLSSLYYTLNFFNNDTPTRQTLKHGITHSCERYKHIEDAIKNDSSKDKYQPENKCANGVFSYNILYDHLNLKDGQITALKKIENMDIRWTESYLLINK